MKKLLTLLLAAALVFSMAACGTNTQKPDGTSGTDRPMDNGYADPYPAIAAMEDHYERSAAVYDMVLGEFLAAYEHAKEARSLSERYALMAIAEAKMLGAGVFLPTTSKGGNYAMTRVAPYTNTPVLWGNDTYRYHDRIVVTEPIRAEHITQMRNEWAARMGTGTYENYVKGFLSEKGYTVKDSLKVYFDADPESWDVLATSNTADSEILVNTYDGLYEYDMENQLQPALAESYTVSEDGTVYTFRLRQGLKWVDNQGRAVADVKADDFVAGMQHMMDAMGGLERLVAGVIVNASEYIGGDITDFSQVGVKAIDDYTLEYTLVQSTPYFMTMLGYGAFAPMSRAYYTSRGGQFGEDFDDGAASYTYGKGPDSIAYCGPFVITNFTSNNTIAMQANASYWNREGNNLTALTYLYNDGADARKPYDDFFSGVVDTMSMTAERVAIAREKGTYDAYAYLEDTDATTYCGFFNVNRSAFANFNDAGMGVSVKNERQIARTGSAMLNRHFRLALAMSIDRATYNAQAVGDALKYNALINSYTPGHFQTLPEEATVSVNGTERTYAPGTAYGQILQDQLDADGVALTVWNGYSSSGFDGWYNPEAARAELELAAAELGSAGVPISAENPIYIDLPVRNDSQVNMNRKQAMKQSIESATGGLIRVNLVEYATRDTYLDATYWYGTGDEANFDLNDGSGWGPDYGDPQTYLDTMLPYGAGYMLKSLGLF